MGNTVVIDHLGDDFRSQLTEICKIFRLRRTILKNVEFPPPLDFPFFLTRGGELNDIGWWESANVAKLIFIDYARWRFRRLFHIGSLVDGKIGSNMHLRCVRARFCARWRFSGCIHPQNMILYRISGLCGIWATKNGLISSVDAFWDQNPEIRVRVSWIWYLRMCFELFCFLCGIRWDQKLNFRFSKKIWS